MLRTLVYSTAGLMVAAGGPAAYFSAPDYWKSVKSEWFPAEKSSERTVADSSTDEGLAIEGAPVSDFAEVLRFDVTPQWITGRWPRVSTGLSYTQLQGYRVPVVTGTKATDLAGSLTYYFNAQQKVQRITFHGTTGDPQLLIRLLTSHYRFVRRLTNDPGLIVFQAPHADGQHTSVLKLTSVGVINSSDPRRRMNVELALERQG